LLPAIAKTASFKMVPNEISGKILYKMSCHACI